MNGLDSLTDEELAAQSLQQGEASNEGFPGGDHDGIHAFNHHLVDSLNQDEARNEGTSAYVHGQAEIGHQGILHQANVADDEHDQDDSGDHEDNSHH